MHNFQQSLRVGLFFVFGLLLVWVLRESLLGSGGPTFAHGGYQLRAIFDDVEQLSTGDEVRLAGIRIGSVAGATLRGGRAEIILNINDGVDVPRGSYASVAMAGLLGQNYVAIHPSEEPGMFANEDLILTKKTANLQAVVASFGEIGDKLAKAFDEVSGTEDKPGLFKNLNHLLLDNRNRFDSILANLDSITTKVNQGQGTLGLLVNDRELYVQILEAAKSVQSLGQLTESATGLIKKVEEGQGALGALLSDPATADNLKRTFSNLASFTDKLNDEHSTLGRLVSDDTLYVQAEQLLHKADSALSSMTDSAPLSAVGVAATALF